MKRSSGWSNVRGRWYSTTVRNSAYDTTMRKRKRERERGKMRKTRIGRIRKIIWARVRTTRSTLEFLIRATFSDFSLLPGTARLTAGGANQRRRKYMWQLDERHALRCVSIGGLNTPYESQVQRRTKLAIRGYHPQFVSRVVSSPVLHLSSPRSRRTKTPSFPHLTLLSTIYSTYILLLESLVETWQSRANARAQPVTSKYLRWVQLEKTREVWPAGPTVSNVAYVARRVRRLLFIHPEVQFSFVQHF